MTDDTNNKTEPEGKETPKTPEEPLSKLDELKATIAILEEKTKEAKAENDRTEKLKGEELLAGTAGGNVEVKQKEETPLEYRDRIDKEISEGKHAD